MLDERDEAQWRLALGADELEPEGPGESSAHGMYFDLRVGGSGFSGFFVAAWMRNLGREAGDEGERLTEPPARRPRGSAPASLDYQPTPICRANSVG